ncbi:ras-responsive element-binding protein 1 isoform X1 [Electrophorus electricus]|uniref:ras-responsive element-binding protein 1 isoform X1 n=1 Tax=Electrophorus electricus TaxID=8005 RepID=UPI0015D02C81|nr:ras-responsive element-binding protein 1 isoform X1 [Electrophorus electricus]
MESTLQERRGTDSAVLAVGREPPRQGGEIPSGRSEPTGGKPERELGRVGTPRGENGSAEGKATEGAAQEEEEGGGEEGEGCHANSTMCSVTNTGQENGGAEPAASNPSPKTPSKSPSANRTGRKNQEVKERSSFLCPLCDKNCVTQHQLTMHIRQHNTENGGTDHSCSICGKALSSASSLDRHMLVHSGERPYKCTACGQTFTTNGNMHRHMKIHDKDPNSVPASSPASPNKRRRPTTKRKPSIEDDGETIDEPPNKKQAGEPSLVKREEELLHCPICFKTFICKYGLESHMETHPDTALRCNLCCITFRTHRGLLRHNSVIHKQLPTDPEGRPFIQSNPSVPLGFSDLSFIDFSCHKFPQIAQVWCETNLRRCSSKFHRFVCEVCNKAFPLQVSLDLHAESHKADKDASADPQDQEADDSGAVDPKGTAEPVPHEDAGAVNGKKGFMEALGLQLSSLAKPERSEEEIHQAIFDSIHFIHVQPPATNLPQETSSSLGLCLLDPVSVQGLNKNTGLSLLSLQPVQGSLVVRPVSGPNGVELADIQQILKMAASMPLLPKAPGGPLQADPRQMTSLKPRPPVTPRSSMGTSTPPPPVMNAQQASSGCISPGLPPPAGQLLVTSKQSTDSSSSSNSSSPTSWENTHLGADGTVAMITTYNLSTENIKQEDVRGKEKDVRTPGGKKIPKTEYPCRFCTQVFSFAGGLQAHMRHHLGVSPYQCSICTYSAPDNATLMRHLRTHSGERPYICRLCHYPFTVKANCERHLRKKHMKSTRKEIEKNIEYVATSSNASGLIGGTTQDFLDSACTGNTSCRYCGEDLKSYRALQIHLRTHNGCQRKPFECSQCGAAFLAKRNCINHLLKQHPEVPEREIEEQINTLVPVTSAVVANSLASASNGLPHAVQPQSGKQDLSTPSRADDQDQPLDFSSKTLKTIGSNIKLDTAASSQLSSNESSMEPIDLSIPKVPEGKKVKREPVSATSRYPQELKKELPSPSTDRPSGKDPGVHAPLPLSTPRLACTLTGDLSKPLTTRLKPLLPKPAAATSTSEMPPLASIAQIISSVSAAPVLLKPGINTEKSERAMGGETLNGKKSSAGTVNPKFSVLKRRGKKRPFKEDACDPLAAAAGGIDLESSGEFPSVEKMLATTDTNKFIPYLQSSQVDSAKDESEKEKLSASEEEKEGRGDSPKPRPQSKGKKNAYSNSVQKMKCPYCPRVFPWTSSLQRHMLTHTGQKPFPCPQCDAFFSTKSNCERHLLRKHGVSSRSALQTPGQRPKPKADEGSLGSTEGVSDTDPALLGDAVGPKKEEKLTENDKLTTEQPSHSAAEQLDGKTDLEHSQSPVCSTVNTEKTDEDSQSNKSLDNDFASKLIEFKLSGSAQQQPEGTEPPSVAEGAVAKEFPHTCVTCKKTFRHAATLSRHVKIHLRESQPAERGRKGRPQLPEPCLPPSAGAAPGNEPEQERRATEKEESGSAVESSAEEEKEEAQKEERSDEEEDGSFSGLGGLEEENEMAGGRTDKRKKICSVCNKRFWSLQDLTRHMRSHTGERPYRCPTCERTFTLKHSLVRHQRIHQKAPDSRGAEGSDDPEEANGGRDASPVDEEVLCSSGSENEADAPAKIEPQSRETGASQAEEGQGDSAEEPAEKRQAADEDAGVQEERDSTAEAPKGRQAMETRDAESEAEETRKTASADPQPRSDGCF